MADGPPGRVNPEEMPSSLSDDDSTDDGTNDDTPGRLNLRELKEFLKDFEQYRWQQLMEEEQKDAKRLPEQREILKKARASKKNLVEFKDMLIRYRKRPNHKYTEIDLIKKFISLGPHGRDPEVLELFERDEKGNISFENMQKISDLLGPYAFRLDLEVPNFVERVFPFDQLISEFCITNIITKVGDSIDDLAYSFDAA